jgi:hypothetical protein
MITKPELQWELNGICLVATGQSGARYEVSMGEATKMWYAAFKGAHEAFFTGTLIECLGVCEGREYATTA